MKRTRLTAGEMADRRIVRDSVFRRDGGCLAAEVEVWGRCYGDLTPHHLLKSVHGGPYSEDNLIALCAHHNQMVENDPPRARELGFVTEPYQKIRGCA